MTDALDQAQEREDRLAEIRRPVERICVRCGNALPRTLIERMPDATDCGGACNISNGDRA